MNPGFADPVLDSQAAFRALMEAMARPGRLQHVAPFEALPLGLHPAAAAALLTLTDAETSLWTDAPAPVGEWLAFHCGGCRVAHPAQAQFLLALGDPPALALLNAGTDEAPHEGATLIIQTRGLVAEGGWQLSGPGIEHRHRLAVAGLPGSFLTEWQANHALFPRGIDLILTHGLSLAALPRTTRIEDVG